MVTVETFLSELLNSIADMGPEFVNVATRDPLAGVLVLFGALFVFAAVAVFGGLTLGALVDLITPSG
ncbi:MAG: hypothetical protein V5A34_08135 [Halapricum sp.]